jgi:hypothetical protein
MIWERKKKREEEDQQQIKQRFSNGRIVDCIFLLSLSIYGLYLIRAMFAPGYFYTYDLNQHLTESFYVATVLLPKYHQLIGWNPYYYLGWPQGQFNPPASYLIYSLLYYSLSWALSPLLIYKIMIAFFFLLQGFSIYYAARGFGLGRLSAFIGGFIALGTSGGFETGGPLAIAYYGMYEFALAVALIPLALAIFHQSFVRKSYSLLLLTALLVAFDFLLHTLAGTFLVFALAIYTIGELFRSGFFDEKNRNFTNRIKNMMRAALKFAVIVLIVAGICSFWILPAMAERGYYASESSFVTELGNYATTYNELHIGFIFGEQASPLITNIFHFSTHPTLTAMLYDPEQTIMSYSTTTFYQLLLVLAILGAGFSLARSRSRFPILIILFLTGIFIFISLGPNYYSVLWANPSFTMLDLRPARAAAVARVFLALLGGAAIGESFALANKGVSKLRTLHHRGPALLLRIGAIIVLVFLGITLLVNSYALMNQLPLGHTAGTLSGGGSDVPEVLAWIKQNVPNNTRVAFEEYPDQVYPSHLFAIAPLETGDQEIGSNYGFWWSSADATNAISEILTSEDYGGNSLYSTLSGLNAGYVVVWGYAASGLSNFPANFVLVQTFGEFQIYKLKNFSPSYATIQGGGSGNAVVTSFQPEQMVIHLQNVTAGESVLVRQSYFSNWIAYSSSGAKLPVRGENVSLPLVTATFIRISIEKSGTYDITLSYGQTRSDTMGDNISSFSLLVFLVASIFTLVESKTKYPIAEYLALVIRRTSDIVRSVTIVNASTSESEGEETQVN